MGSHERLGHVGACGQKREDGVSVAGSYGVYIVAVKAIP